MISFIVFIIIFVCNCNASINTNYSAWIVPATPLFPRADVHIAVASYNNIAFLFGGSVNPKQVIKFDVITQNMTDLGSDTFPVDTYGYSQYYTQLNDLFFCIDVGSGSSIDSGTKIIIYNLLSKQVWENNIIIQNTVGLYGCLASNNNLLFVVGGFNVNAGTTGILNALQIYDISSELWLSGSPSMQTGRVEHSCIVHPINGALYAIAGVDDLGPINTHYLKSVEKILIGNNVANQSWVYVGDISNSLAATRTIIYQDSVVIFGGHDINGIVLPEIQLINCVNNQISIGGYLKYPVTGTAAIFVNSRLYAFAGNDGTGYLKKWQYLDLLTSNVPTTYIPSLSPNSMLPTNTPSTTPTTFASTTFPTTTLAPTTSAPTTSAPTSIPTNSATTFAQTTSMPTKQTPTHSPTTFPSSTANYPSLPSISPTISNQTASLNPTTSTLVSNINIIPLNKANDNILMLLFSIIGSFLLCIVILICVFCIVKLRKLDNESRAHNKQTQYLSKNVKNPQSGCDNIAIQQIESDDEENNMSTKGDGVKWDEFIVQNYSDNDQIIDNKVTPQSMPTPNGISISNQHKKESDALIVKEWLGNAIALPEYLNNFINNGYETMEIIADITGIAELLEIGIVSREHHMRILEGIEKLRPDIEIIGYEEDQIEGLQHIESEGK